jgi:hypothetical protein
MTSAQKQNLYRAYSSNIDQGLIPGINANIRIPNSVHVRVPNSYH